MKKLLTMLVMVAEIAAGQTGLNVWNIDVEANSDSIPTTSRQFARGESWLIAPRVLDNGVPRAWPTNTSFFFFWQRQNGSTNWWVSTNATWPVYKTVQQTVSTGVVFYAVSNTVSTTITNQYIFNTNGYITGYTMVTNTASATTTNQFTNTISAVVLSSIIDTGRVWLSWNNNMDVGVNSYNWFMGAYVGSNVSYRLNGTITMLGAPGVGGSFIGNPLTFPWATTNFVTNLFGQVTSYALRVVTNGAPSGYYFLQTPTP